MNRYKGGGCEPFESFFDECLIFVVSVESFEERHRSIAGQLDRMGLAYEFIFEFDPGQFPAVLPFTFSEGLPIKSISCLLKHLEAQRRLLDSEKKFAFILEDDCIFFPSFEAQLGRLIDLIRSLPPSFLVFIGGADNKLRDDYFKQTDLFLIADPLTTAESYFVDKPSCEQRLKYLGRQLISKALDHLLVQTDRVLNIPQFRTSEPLVLQGSIDGSFITTLDDSRRKKSKQFLKARYHWNRFRRQIIFRLWGRLLKTRDKQQ